MPLPSFGLSATTPMLVGYSVHTGLAPITKMGADNIPIQGPRVLAITLQFSAAINQIAVELFKEGVEHQMDFVQTIHIDNSASALPISVIADVTQQRLVIPANKQAILPLYCIDQPRLTFTKIAVGAETIIAIVSNVAQGPIVW